MKKQVNPVFTAIAIVVALGAAMMLIFTRARGSDNDTQLPPEVVKRLKATGPQPMPPRPSRAFNAPGATQQGPPVKN